MHYKLSQAYLLLLIFSITGCKAFLDVPSPVIQDSDKEVFSNNEKATGLLLAIYPSLLDGDASPYAMERLTALCSDELVNYTNDDNLEVYQNKIGPGNIFPTGFWNAAYNSVYKANDVYLGCSASDKLDPVVKKQLMGEALLIRSWIFFNLVNLYGDIPIVLTTDYKVTGKPFRSSEEEVYDKIIIDLVAARNDLNEDYTGPDSKTPSNERIRPNKAVATALLSRVYLYNGRYSDAEREATSVINSRDAYSLVPLAEVFKKNSAEAIWQIRTPDDNIFGINTHEGADFFLADPPYLTGKSALQRSLVNSFEKGDLRINAWVGTYIDSTVIPPDIYYYPDKYKVRNGNDITEYTMILRLAELYLIRAEARARLDNLPGAINDVNMIRKRAGLPLLTPLSSVTQKDVLNIILAERQHELFTEGHRWFDIRRSDHLDAIMNTASQLKESTWKNTMKYWPIPADELLLNPNILQNPGYE